MSEKRELSKVSIGFSWGPRKGVTQSGDITYESFTLKGVQYDLYDCVYFYQAGDTETSIGKLVKVYETPAHEKKVKVVWLFRPIDIRRFLRDVEPSWNELFLASGNGVGVSNVNPLVKLQYSYLSYAIFTLSCLALL